MVAEGGLVVVVATEAERPRGIGAEVLVSGVGKVGAATAAAARLSRGGVASIVSFGVAGAYPASGLAIGDVVVATEVAVLDEGRDEGGEFIAFDRQGMRVPGAGWTSVDASLFRRLTDEPVNGVRFVVGRVGTVSVCAGTGARVAERTAAGALAEAMEGAAVAHAAAFFRVPFAEVRGISNVCGPRAGRSFELAAAVRSAEHVLARLERG